MNFRFWLNEPPNGYNHSGHSHCPIISIQEAVAITTLDVDRGQNEIEEGHYEQDPEPFVAPG